MTSGCIQVGLCLSSSTFFLFLKENWPLGDELLSCLHDVLRCDVNYALQCHTSFASK